ncbi:MAG: hypothetical protein ACI9MR_001098 [Myxococcota bacterium]|jgi:hypothetical protein
MRRLPIDGVCVALLASLVTLSAACSDPATGNDTEDSAVTDTEPQDSAQPDGVDSTPSDSADDSRVDDTVEPTDTALPRVFSLNCDADADCLVACGAGTCSAGRCRFERLTGACVVPDGDVNQARCVPAGALDPVTACQVCNPSAQAMGYSSVVFGADFETGLQGMATLNLTGSDASWSVSSARASAGVRSAYFGDPTQDTYAVGQRARGTLTTPALTFPSEAAAADVTLTFDLFLDTEETPAFDYVRILLDRGGSSIPEIIWHSDSLGGTTFGVFLPIAVPLGTLPETGATVIFEFDSLDEKINGFEGAYLDSVRVTTGCCAADADCDDANACTTDLCDTDGRCVFSTVEGCCLRDVDCDDADPCTADRCDATANVCKSEPVAGCCGVSADCNDLDACTEDVCDADGGCLNRPICCAADVDCDDGDACTTGACDGGECSYALACCELDDDCDDNDACTSDRCVGDRCLNVFEPGPGCCKPDILTERFDAPLPPGWTLDPGNNNIGWRLQTTSDAQSGAQVLYYGHPTLNWYDSGNVNQGDARSPLFQVPEGVDARLTLRVLLDVEPDATRDRFSVLAEVAGETVLLADKSALSLGVFQSIDVNIGYLAGQSVRIILRFETIDNQSNQTRGVLVDDLRVTSSCQPRACANASACGSQTPCIAGRCEAGACAYEAVDCE